MENLKSLFDETLRRQLAEGKVQIRETQDETGTLVQRIVTRTFECDPRLLTIFYPPPLFSEAALATIMANLFAELDKKQLAPCTRKRIETFLREFAQKYTDELDKRGLPVQLSLFK